MTDIRIVHGDITQLAVDAIVNAANSGLAGGGGVDGAIHRAAGPELVEACRRLRATTHKHGLPTGEAVATPGFNLPARWIIHTVGPVWQGGREGEPELLAACYNNSLQCALSLNDNIQTIAFPAISTGVFGYPKKLAEIVERTALENFMDKNPDVFDQIFLVRF